MLTGPALTSEGVAVEGLLRVFFSLRFANSMVYYGVYMITPYIGGSVHFNFFLASVIELPAIPAGIWIYNKLVKIPPNLFV